MGVTNTIEQMRQNSEAVHVTLTSPGFEGWPSEHL